MERDAIMRVMVLIKADARSESGEIPDEKLLVAMGQYNQALFDAGVMQAGEGLKPSSLGKRVRLSGESRTVIDGPFSETGQLLAGFWLWKVASMDEAVEWVRRMPNPMPGTEPEIEIRPVFESGDFAGLDSTGEVIAAEQAMRSKLTGE